MILPVQEHYAQLFSSCRHIMSAGSTTASESGTRVKSKCSSLAARTRKLFYDLCTHGKVRAGLALLFVLLAAHIVLNNLPGLTSCVVVTISGLCC